MAVSELAKQRSRAIHAAHQAFLRDGERTLDFRPESRPGSPDYNVQAIDLDADPDLEWEFTQFGLDIDRGRYDDQLDQIIASGTRPA